MRACLLMYLALASSATAQPLVNEDFDDADFGGWTVNGQQMTFPDDREGSYMGVPYLDFMGVVLRNDLPGSPVTGDLTRHAGPIRIRVEVRVFQLNNWFGNPIDPSGFPLVLQFWDYSGPVPVSVYTEGPGLPQIADGWTTFEYLVPDPASDVLPPGWGGTGDEDPRTGDPRLPPGRTYASVLRHVDQISIGTFRPGWFYISNWWQMGFDNVFVEVLRDLPCDPDFNQDGVADQDDVAYLVNVIAGGDNPTGRDPDFDENGVADQDDYAALVDVIAGGACP